MVENEFDFQDTSIRPPLRAPEASADFRHSIGHSIGYIPALGTNVAKSWEIFFTQNFQPSFPCLPSGNLT